MLLFYRPHFVPRLKVYFFRFFSSCRFPEKYAKAKKRRECLACVKVASFLSPLSFRLSPFHPFNAWLGSRNGKWAFNSPPPVLSHIRAEESLNSGFPHRKRKKFKNALLKNIFYFFSALGKDRASKSPSGKKRKEKKENTTSCFPDSH